MTDSNTLVDNIFKNPLDVSNIQNIWNKTNKNNVILSQDTLIFLLTDLFIPLFGKIWSSNNLYVTLQNYLDDVEGSEKIIEILKPILQNKDRDINLMYEEGNIIIENFFKLFENVSSINIYMIKDCIFKCQEFALLFRKITCPNMSVKSQLYLDYKF